MSKILKIDNEEGIVYIGTKENEIFETDINNLNFIPKIGDIVEVYETNGTTIVAKKNNIQFDQNNTNIDGKKAVDKAGYCLLTFFFGAIGIHKFYAGKTGAGIVYLLFCWTLIPAFIAFIELIIGLFQKPDSNGNIYV